VSLHKVVLPDRIFLPDCYVVQKILYHNIKLATMGNVSLRDCLHRYR